MIQTGDWDMHDLIRYLVAVQDSLSDLELSRLRETSAFMGEETVLFPPNGVEGHNAAVKKRFKPRELYEPTPALRNLGLPLLAWGSNRNWKPSNEEGMHVFFFACKTPEPCQLNFCTSWA
jgi:hypothetical protein